MPLTTTETMLRNAQENKYAIGAFNVENLEMMMAVIEAAEEMNAPVILQTTPSTLRYAAPKTFFAMARALAEGSRVPVSLHLDHGNSETMADETMKSGYTSVMIDGSHEDLETNIAMTKRVVEAAKRYGICVEAELGSIGGKEDDTVGKGDIYTDPLQAKEFVERTGVHSLAVAIGTAHGFYKDEPKLDKDRLRHIRETVSVPLVLHGASGVSDEDVKDCIALGICKVNFATELRVAFTDGIKEALAEKPTIYDPKPLGKAGMARVKDLVKHKMAVCGCCGRADLL